MNYCNNRSTLKQWPENPSQNCNSLESYNQNKSEGMSTTTAVFAYTISSPDSVMHPSPHHAVEAFVLTRDNTEQQHQQKKRKCDEWVCPASAKSRRTMNPIRSVIDPITRNIKLGCQRADGKDLISLANGDATAGGNLSPCPVAMEALAKAALFKPHAAGYANACGTPEARLAIAKHHSYPEHRILPENVIVASGCSGALELALTSLLDPGTTLLVPQPGFPLYQVIAESHGATVVHYRLDLDRNWEVDMDHLKEIMLTHPNVRAMVVNNPSSPTGAVFSERHLMQILDFAAKNHLPIVADEVYGDLTFGSNQFHPLAQVAAKLGRQVPVITTSGLSKQFLLPGWRVGWTTFHDNIHGSLSDVEAGAKRLSQISLGTSHLSQAIIPSLLSPSSPRVGEWKRNLCATLERHAMFLCSRLDACDGLEVIQPQGAMYAIAKIDTTSLDVKDDIEFASKLLDEENVFVLPGSAFGVQNIFRVVYCSSEPILETAAKRISEFCHRHANTSLR